MNKTEHIEFSQTLGTLDMHERMWSKGGDWDILRVPGGYLYSRWLYDPVANDWVVGTTTFVPVYKG